MDKKSFKSRNEEEVAGYADLMNMIFDDYSVIPLTENHINLETAVGRAGECRPGVGGPGAIESAGSRLQGGATPPAHSGAVLTGT